MLNRLKKSIFGTSQKQLSSESNINDLVKPKELVESNGQKQQLSDSDIVKEFDGLDDEESKVPRKESIKFDYQQTFFKSAPDVKVAAIQLTELHRCEHYMQQHNIIYNAEALKIFVTLPLYKQNLMIKNVIREYVGYRPWDVIVGKSFLSLIYKPYKEEDCKTDWKILTDAFKNNSPYIFRYIPFNGAFFGEGNFYEIEINSNNFIKCAIHIILQNKENLNELTKLADIALHKKHNFLM